MKKRQNKSYLPPVLLVFVFQRQVLCPAAHLTTAAVPENSSFEVLYIDVGQGDSELVICDGHAMLIDGGSWWTHSSHNVHLP